MMEHERLMVRLCEEQVEVNEVEIEVVVERVRDAPPQQELPILLPLEFLFTQV